MASIAFTENWSTEGQKSSYQREKWSNQCHQPKLQDLLKAVKQDKLTKFTYTNIQTSHMEK